jgi:hypothetical protein
MDEPNRILVLSKLIVDRASLGEKQFTLLIELLTKCALLRQDCQHLTTRCTISTGGEPLLHCQTGGFETSSRGVRPIEIHSKASTTHLAGRFYALY